jgi:phage-related tail fiber protein
VAAGVVSLAATGVVAGTYPKVTVDAKGRVTGATTLVVGDLPAHTHVATDIVSGSLPFTIKKAGTAIGTRRALNLIEGSNVTLTVADDADNDRVNVTVVGILPSHSHAQSDVTSLTTDLASKAAKAGDTFTGAVAVAIGASGDDPFTLSGNNSNLADHTLLKVLNNGELIIAGGSGNGYRMAELMAASNPSGWSGVIKVKNPAGVTAGYILLYSNP